MATHSSILAWEIPWMEEPGRLQSKYLVILGNTSYQVLIKSVKLLSYYQRTFSTCNIKRRKHTSPDLNLKWVGKKKTIKYFLIKKYLVSRSFYPSDPVAKIPHATTKTQHSQIFKKLLEYSIRIWVDYRKPSKYISEEFFVENNSM